MTSSPFDHMIWRHKCKELADEANRGAGLSYDYFVERFSISVDRTIANLCDVDRAEAILAATDFGYASVAEREQTLQDNLQDGCCAHGIDRNCCPAGCGDLGTEGFDDDDGEMQ